MSFGLGIIFSYFPSLIHTPKNMERLITISRQVPYKVLDGNELGKKLSQTFNSLINFKFTSRSPFLYPNSLKAEVMASACFSSTACYTMRKIIMYPNHNAKKPLNEEKNENSSQYSCIQEQRQTILISENFLSSAYFSFNSRNSYHHKDFLCKV